jgi:hypothetical protein
MKNLTKSITCSSASERRIDFRTDEVAFRRRMKVSDWNLGAPRGT